MRQFDLLIWLQDKTRKVVTRDGREVEILKTDFRGYKQIVGVIKNSDNKDDEVEQWDGLGYFRGLFGESKYDLFFADKEEKLQSIEIPFGAKDSEFVRDEYYIPEGCEARIEGNKVIIEKVQKEELTEFEKELQQIINDYAEKEVMNNHHAKNVANGLLDLARKEVGKTNTIVDKDNYIRNCDYYYEQGKQDALKSLPKWKKIPRGISRKDLFDMMHKHIVLAFNDCVDYYYLDESDLRKLPKEE